jgi:hypothetical protein
MLEIENDFTSTNKYYLLAIENTNNDLSQKGLNEMLKELELDYLFNTP